MSKAQDMKDLKVKTREGRTVVFKQIRHNAFRCSDRWVIEKVNGSWVGIDRHQRTISRPFQTARDVAEQWIVSHFV